MESRRLLAVTASFVPATGVLSVNGDASANSIVVNRDVAGNIFVNGGAVPVSGGTPTIANTTLINIAGNDGNDNISLDQTNGLLPKSSISGGNGNDTLTGGSGIDTLSGDADSDLIIWNSGGGSDLIEGGGGTDFFQVNGNNTAEAFSADGIGNGLIFLSEIDPVPTDLVVGTVEHLTVNLNGGDDTFFGPSDLETLQSTTVDGGTGNDTIIGSSGPDNLLGGDGSDFIDGNAGADNVLMGDGDDTFQWDPGDGSDMVEGMAGTDILTFNGSNDPETISIAANGSTVVVGEDQGNVAMNVDGVEQAIVSVFGGADTVVVSDLAGTALRHVKVKLNPDGQPDNTIIDATDSADAIALDGDAANGVDVTGLAAEVDVIGALGADGLTINAMGGADAIDASGLDAGAVNLVLNGGAANDTFTGSKGDDMVNGGPGSDVAHLGDGDDTFLWAPGDGSDVVEGELGRDTLQFNGSTQPESFALAANGNHARLTRDVGNVAMDLNGLEEIDLGAAGGADTVTVNDQSATGLNTFNVDLGGPEGLLPGQADAIVINGTDAGDVAQIRSIGLQIDATISAIPFVHITGSAATLDTLTVNMLGGNDTLDASDLFATNASQLIKLIVVGGTGNDTLTGSLGFDTFVWNAGDGSDVIDGIDGEDTFVLNGSDAADTFDLSANGSHARSNVGGATTDAANFEEIDVNPLGGADDVTLNDLSGTPLEQIRLSLSATAGGTAGDGQADAVTINGRNVADSLQIIGHNGVVVVDGSVAGFPYFLVLNAIEAGDSLRVDGAGGNDHLVTDVETPVNFSVDGGAGTDTVDVLSTGPLGAAHILPSTGDDAINVNLDGLGIANVFFDSTQRIGQLDINSGGVATLSSGGGKVLTVTGLVVGGTSRLDLSDNNLIVDYSGNSQLPGVRQVLASGYNGGAWNGPGIMTSAGDASHFALGYGEASALFPGGTFAGQPVDATAIVVKFTRYGDANLDGHVDVTDLGKLATNWQQAGRDWFTGDFNYDLSADVSDLGVLATNWQLSVPSSFQQMGARRGSLGELA